MHITIVEIENIRGFEELHWKVDANLAKGWHVVIGDNASGKSTFLRSIALALCGPQDIQALREDWATWLRNETSHGEVKVFVQQHDAWDKWSGPGRALKRWHPGCGLQFSWNPFNVTVQALEFEHEPTRHLWSRNPGWFSASYGPYRRFTGGDPEQKKLFYSHPFLARHLTNFFENVALTETLEWLQQLRFEELDGSIESGDLLSEVTAFVNQNQFLPHEVKFERVTSKEVVFRNPEGMDIDITRLSDGFRSILSFAFELIRQMAACYGPERLFKKDEKANRIVIQPPGVVLIDEVDAHLHPTWQRRIGKWLTAFFPNIQFIVSTHSPLVCQAASKGTIFRLPDPTGKDPRKAGFVEGVERERLIHGDVLDAYGTELFGAGVNRSDEAQKKMEELARLNQKALRKKLSAKETARRENLMQTYSSLPVSK